MALEDIGEWANALLCITDKTACCSQHFTGKMGHGIGNWFFPNGSRLPSAVVNNTIDTQWDFFRSRDQMIVLMHRRRGGVNGIYHCVLPNAMNVTQTMYIGVYTARAGEWYVLKQFKVL